MKFEVGDLVYAKQGIDRLINKVGKISDKGLIPGGETLGKDYYLVHYSDNDSNQYFFHKDYLVKL